MRARPFRSRWPTWTLALAVVAAAVPAAAQGYDTGTFVAADGNQCAGAPACVAEVQVAVLVPARGRVPARFSCSGARPHLWGWDVGQHQHIGVRLVAIDRSSATVEGASLADAPGHFVVSLGCSTEPYTGAPLLESRHLAPTGWLGRGHRRSDATHDAR